VREEATLGLDVRYIFLVLLFLTAVIYILRQGTAAVGIGDLWHILLDFLLVPLALGTALTFGLLMTRTDPMPMIRELAYRLSLEQLVSFERAIPSNLEENLAVASIDRHDTDGDGSKEWIVFYQFDLQAGRRPIGTAIFDNDRGSPPVIFPYQLRVPDRDYLAEDARSLQVSYQPVTADQNGPDGKDLDEILISDNNQLSIFRFKENSEIWDFPRDAPPRYQPIGFFRGNVDGTVKGATFDEITKDVTVINREPFERSQLAVRSVYALNPVTNSYWDDFDSTVLAAPIISTIDFYANPPDDILNTAFPEKIALAFYASTCGSTDETLCRNARVEWEPSIFLAEDALGEYQNVNPAYFGLSGFSNSQNISVSHLRYYPALETDPELSREVVTGAEPQLNVVDIAFVANSLPLQTARFKMGLLDGQWKILRRLEGFDPLVLDATPTEIQTPLQE
jgi:hypothetical protein